MTTLQEQLDLAVSHANDAIGKPHGSDEVGLAQYHRAQAAQALMPLAASCRPTKPDKLSMASRIVLLSFELVESHIYWRSHFETKDEREARKAASGDEAADGGFGA